MDRSEGTQAGAVPGRLTSFVGREAERAQVAGLVGAHRLVTVAGPGGCGKTSLAGQVAPEVAGILGARLSWIDLGPVPADPGRVAYAALAALGIGDVLGMDPVDRMTGLLAEDRVLLVLDNCEHLAEPAGKFAALVLAACPNVRVLATSREPLGAEGELVWRVPTLSTPAPGETDPAAVLATEAGRLFAERGAEALRGFRVEEGNAADVAALCVRLDGLPLAIELAAARVRSLRPDRILAGLDQRFRLLTGGQADALPHQQTLAASVEWSHALLTDLERVLLRRLSVFPGTFSLEAAEAVATGDLLGAADHLGPAGVGPLEGYDVLVLLSDVVERSLVTFDGRRYRLPHTIREFAAAAATAAGEDKALRGAHLAYYAGLAAAAAVELGTNPALATLDRLDAEYDNLQAAIAAALDAGADAVAVALVSDLTLWWMMRGRYAESHVWYGRVMAEVPTEPAVDRAWPLWGIGLLGLFSMDTAGGFGIAETAQAVELATAAGDDRLLGRALGRQGFFTAFVAPASTAPMFAEALAASTRAGDTFGILTAHAWAALAAGFGCDDADAVAPHVAALAAVADASPYWRCWHALCAGIPLGRAGQVGPAVKLLRQAWDAVWEVGDPMLESWIATFLADALVAAGDTAGAEAVVGRSAPVQVKSAFARFEFVSARGVHAALADGDAVLARLRLDRVLATLTGCGIPFVIIEGTLLSGRLALLEGDAAGAAAAARTAAEVATALASPWYRVAADDLAGRAAAALGDAAAAEDALQRALGLCARHSFAGVGADVCERIASLAAAGGSSAESARLYGAAQGLRAASGARRARADQPSYDADLTRLQKVLGEAAWAELCAQGAALDLAGVAAYALRARGERKRPPTGWASLTPTELAVVDLVAEGLSNAAIAARMFITTATTKSHLHHVFTKLGVANRTQLAAAVLARKAEQSK